MEINTNNDSLDYMIRREIDVLSINRILSQNHFNVSPYDQVKSHINWISGCLNNIKKIQEGTFPNLDEKAITDLKCQRYLSDLRKALDSSIEVVLKDKSYDAHILAVSVLSIFCLFPSLMNRKRVYFFLRELRKEFII